MNDATLFPLLAAGLALVSVLVVFAGLFSSTGDQGRVEQLKARIAGWRGGQGRKGDGEAGRGGVASLLSLLARLGDKVGPDDTDEYCEEKVRLVQAGYRSPDAASVLWGSRCVLALCLGAISFLLIMLLTDGIASSITALIAVSGAMLGYYFPALWLRSKIKKRRQGIMEELPDALDLLVVCVEAGMGLDQAINRVTNELDLSSPLICQEFRILNLELRAGMNRQQALRNLSRRIGVEDMDNLVTLLIQSDIFGTSVARTLRVFSDTLRAKRSQRAEEMAAKLPVKLLIPLILFIFPALLVVIMGPAGIQLMGVFAMINK